MTYEEQREIITEFLDYLNRTGIFLVDFAALDQYRALRDLEGLDINDTIDEGELVRGFLGEPETG